MNGHFVSVCVGVEWVYDVMPDLSWQCTVNGINLRAAFMKGNGAYMQAGKPSRSTDTNWRHRKRDGFHFLCMHC